MNLRFLLLTALIWLIPLQTVAVGGDTSVINISATVLSKNKCKFITKTAILDFGTLDTTNAVVKNASTEVTFTCNGADPVATYTISENGGQNNYKMVHGTDGTQFIPYSLTLTPTSGSAPKGDDQVLTINGSIQGSAYQSALVGPYADTVILTIDP